MTNSLWPHEVSPPGSSVRGILQARILEWVAIPFSRGSSQLQDRTQVSHIAGRFFTIWAQWNKKLLAQSHRYQILDPKHHILILSLVFQRKRKKSNIICTNKVKHIAKQLSRGELTHISLPNPLSPFPSATELIKKKKKLHLFFLQSCTYGGSGEERFQI